MPIILLMRLPGLLLENKIESISPMQQGTAATYWSGSQTIHSDNTSSAYRLRDYSRGNGVITLHGESAKRGNDYNSASANWSLNGSDVAALDAHFGVEQTYSYYFYQFRT